MDCRICFDKYNKSNRKPITLLPCCHTFCMSCLSNLKKSSDYLSCPKCRKFICLFKSNHGILDILNKSHDNEVQDENNLDPTEPTCLLEKNKEKNKDLKWNSKTIGSCLFVDGWRSALCKCTKCLDICNLNFVLER